MTEPVLRLVVHGTPGTAGSKSAFPVYRGSGADRQWTGRINVGEKDRHGVKRNWRQAIIDQASDLIACACPDPTCTKLRDPFPLDEALTMSMVFTVAKPSSAPRTRRSWPIARPDLLKYARATEDALKNAGVLKDDARVVDYRRMAKVYPREDSEALDVPGVVICVWRMHDVPGWQRDALTTTGPADTLFDPLTEGAHQ